MLDVHAKLLLILDDREFTSGDVRCLVGTRRFGDITFKRRPLVEHFRGALPAWASKCLIRLQSDDDLATLRSRLETATEDTAACVIASRAGFPRTDLLAQLIERLPYAEEDFTDSLYNPLLVFLRNAHSLVDQWPAFMIGPLHTWEQPWQGNQRLQSIRPLDLGKIRDFLRLPVVRPQRATSTKCRLIRITTPSAPATNARCRLSTHSTAWCQSACDLG